MALNGKRDPPDREEIEDIKRILLFLLRMLIEQNAELVVLQTIALETPLMLEDQYMDLRRQNIESIARNLSERSQVLDNTLLVELLRLARET